jgi:flagellin
MLDINTNIASLMAEDNLSSAQASLAQSFQRLSSGYRINSSADDAAGLAISDSMTSQIRSYAVAGRNANDGISMAQTADGALSQVTDVLQRMSELATQGANGSLQTSDRQYLQTEFSALQSEVKQIMTSTKFNGQQLVNSTSHAVTLQVGIENSADDRITVTFGGVKLTALLSSSTTLSGAATASQSAMSTITSALTSVSGTRAKFGAVMNRLQITSSNIDTASLNLSAANSRIRDVDVASETAQLSSEQVLAQAGTSILAQANQSPQMALSLLH